MSEDHFDNMLGVGQDGATVIKGDDIPTKPFRITVDEGQAHPGEKSHSIPAIIEHQDLLLKMLDELSVLADRLKTRVMGDSIVVQGRIHAGSIKAGPDPSGSLYALRDKTDHAARKVLDITDKVAQLDKFL